MIFVNASKNRFDLGKKIKSKKIEKKNKNLDIK